MARKARARKPLTWAQVAVKNAGIKFGSQALVYGACWAITTESLGREPTMEEFAEWWHESRSSVFRDQSIFRKAFPTLKTPWPIFENNAEARQRIRRVLQKYSDYEALMAAERHELDQAALDIGMLPAF